MFIRICELLFKTTLKMRSKYKFSCSLIYVYSATHKQKITILQICLHFLNGSPFWGCFRWIFSLPFSRPIDTPTCIYSKHWKYGTRSITSKFQLVVETSDMKDMALPSMEMYYSKIITTVYVHLHTTVYNSHCWFEWIIRVALFTEKITSSAYYICQQPWCPHEP